MKGPISQSLQLLRSREASPVELVTAAIEAAEAHKDLNVFITTTFEQALAQAKLAELAYRNNEQSPLTGIPVAIKDLFCTKGIRTTSASRILENFIPPYESTVSDKLARSGAISIGKTNMDEFAMGSATHYSAFGPVISPWKSKRSPTAHLTPGGSSGGSAAVVAARVAMCSLGSDTGGSVRMPAAFCGVVGFKPSYGRCSRYGMIALASSLDQAGVFALSVEDAALVSQEIMGYDDKDSTSANLPTPNLVEAVKRPVQGLRVGLPLDYLESLPQETMTLVCEAADALKSAGAIVTDVRLPHTKYGVAAYYVILPVEASSNLARYDGVRYGLRAFEPGMNLDEMYLATRTAGFGSEVKRRIMAGAYMMSTGFDRGYLTQAQKVRRLMQQDFNSAFAQVDALLAPVVSGEAFSLDDAANLDPITLYLNDAATIPANMAGLPAISIPARLSANGLPLGLQVIGKRFDESSVFRCAAAIENHFNFNAVPSA